MSAATVADMLADLLAPPANAANSANREHPCGLAADFEAANRLRISANPEPHAPEAGPDSQTLAGIRNPENTAQSEHWRGFSQDSLDSQGFLPTIASHLYRLSAAEADAAHAEPWDDATIARFVARVGLLMRRGFSATDADDLAERLHLRDVQGDDRPCCAECEDCQP